MVFLWALTSDLIRGRHESSSHVPFYAAALHIFSPAGVFLSAPYTESLFASLSMSGFWCYVNAVKRLDRGRAFAGCAFMIAAGLSFGCATMVRSNGILAGIPFLLEAIMMSWMIFSQGLSLTRLSRLASVVAGGLLVGVGMILPQFIAYQEYCGDRDFGSRRPWCEMNIPSIFTWAQSHYW